MQLRNWMIIPILALGCIFGYGAKDVKDSKSDYNINPSYTMSMQDDQRESNHRYCGTLVESLNFHSADYYKTSRSCGYTRKNAKLDELDALHRGSYLLFRKCVLSPNDVDITWCDLLENPGMVDLCFQIANGMRDAASGVPFDCSKFKHKEICEYTYDYNFDDNRPDFDDYILEVCE